MVYLHPLENSWVSSGNDDSVAGNNVIEDDVDVVLQKMDGRIERPRDEK